MAFTQALENMPHAAIVIPTVCLLLFFVAKYLREYLSPQARRLRSLPRINYTDDVSLRQKLYQAFYKYSKQGDFYVLNEKYHPVVVIPPKYMNEIKALPESQLSFSEEIYERYNGDLTAMGRFEPSFIKTISGDLTKSIPYILNELVEETEYAFQGLVGDSRGPASVTMLPAAQRIVALLSSRLLVGQPLCHDENWLTSMIVHTNNTFHVSEKVWRYPSMLRQYVAPYMKEFQTMTANRMEVERMLAPLISARQKAAFSEDTGEFGDILQRLIQNAPSSKKADVGYHAHNQLEMSAVGIHTTAQVLTQCIYNLAAYPEYYPELRQELEEVFSQHATEPHTLVMSKPRLAKLIKLDSFMKETQRTDPLGLIIMSRKVMSPTGHTFSNGLHLPHGAFTGVNAYHIGTDPDLYPEPEKFDGLRFAKLHAKGGIHTTKHQFTTVNPEFIQFGLGTHSCPGRFFAATEIKVALAYILLNFNVSFQTGQTRPSNSTNGHFQQPDPNAQIVFTRRDDAWGLSGEVEQH